MERARRLYLVDEFDRVYKQLQRPTAAVAKTRSSIQLSKTLDDNTLDEDEKVRRYVGELHRYLNIADDRAQQQQQQQPKRRKRPLININTSTLPRAVSQTPTSPLRRQLRSEPSRLSALQPHEIALPDDWDDDDDDDDVFASRPQPSTSTTSSTAVKKKKSPKVKSAKTKGAAASGRAAAAKKRQKIDLSDWTAYRR